MSYLFFSWYVSTDLLEMIHVQNRLVRLRREHKPSLTIPRIDDCSGMLAGGGLLEGSKSRACLYVMESYCSGTCCSSCWLC